MQCNVLNSRFEKAYNDIVTLATSICEAPIGLVSLVASNKCRIKANRGLRTVPEFSRTGSFCSTAIKNPTKLLVVNNASRHPYFHNNELVNGPSNIEFYAGRPLLLPNGHAIGTLCVMDTQPRQLSEYQENSLRTLSENIVNLLELRKVKKEKNNLETKLLKSNSDLESFAYATSHDLRSPLRAIQRLTEWVGEDLYSHMDQENLERMEMIYGRVDRMDALLDSLLDYSRAGTRKYTSEVIAANQIVGRIKKSINVSDSFSIKLNTESRKISIPKNPLLAVLTQLVSNAVKHHHKSHGLIDIHLTEGEIFFQIIVSDDGPGIDHEYHKQIFGLFQTLKPRDHTEGTGMGLAIIKKVVMKAGGNICVCSELGKGAKFILTWPKHSNLDVAFDTPTALKMNPFKLGLCQVNEPYSV